MFLYIRLIIAGLQIGGKLENEKIAYLSPLEATLFTS